MAETIVDMRLRPPLASLLETALFSPGSRSATWHPDYPRPRSADLGSADLLIREMDDAGVALGVVMGRKSPGPLGSIPNEEIAQWLERHPGRFVAWAGIDVTEPPERMVAEARRCLSWPRFQGVSIEPTIAPGVQGVDDRTLYPLYELCQDARCPVSITLSAVLQASERRPFDLGAPSRLYRVALDFPRLDIHVAHAAWPWVDEMIGVAFVCPNVWLSPDQYLVPTLPGARRYAQAACSYFQDRTVFGTAYPFKPLAPMVAAYRSWSWPPHLTRRILGENALRLMRLK